jgi:hypothetical protein
VGVSAALAAQSLTPPIYSLSPAVAFGLLVANAMLTYAMAQMPSWNQAERAERAVERTERQPHEGGDFVG